MAAGTVCGYGEKRPWRILHSVGTTIDRRAAGRLEPGATVALAAQCWDRMRRPEQRELPPVGGVSPPDMTGGSSSTTTRGPVRSPQWPGILSLPIIQTTSNAAHTITKTRSHTHKEVAWVVGSEEDAAAGCLKRAPAALGRRKQ
eukprot:602468-Hanusia_phi.AAC.1